MKTGLILTVAAVQLASCRPASQMSRHVLRAPASVPAPLDRDYPINYHGDTRIGQVDFSNDAKNLPMSRATVIKIWIDTAGLTDKTLDSITWVHEQFGDQDWTQPVVGITPNAWGGMISMVGKHDTGEDFNPTGGEHSHMAYNAVQDGIIQFSCRVSADDALSFGVAHVHIEFGE